MSVVTISTETDKLLKPQCTNSAKSMESNFLYAPHLNSKFSALNKRKISTAQMQRDRNPRMIPAVSEVKQRVMSARMLRSKQLHNQIAEMHRKINELTTENRLFRSLHKRQDSALAKYGSNAELPQLLQKHSEEVRTWQAHTRNLSKLNKELNIKIKQKDAYILATTDQNKHLLQLNKDKNLEDREKLADRVRDLEHRLLDKDNDIKLLARRLQLESKTFKANLQNEHMKYRELMLKLEQAHLEISRANGLMEMCENKSQSRFNRPNNHKLTNGINGKIKCSKSASSVGSNQESATPILPPFYEPSFDGGKTARSSPILHKAKNVNLRDDSDDQNGYQDDYNNNSQAKSEKSERNSNFTNGHFFDENDSVTSAIKNGVNQARTNKTVSKFSKLTPIADKPSSKKISESEFSFDDEGSEDYSFMVNDSDARSESIEARAQKKRNEYTEHKRNIEELESKLAEASLEHQEEFLKYQEINGPEAILDVIQARHAHKCNMQLLNGDPDFESMNRQIHDTMLHRETMLDDYCNDVSEISSIRTTNSNMAAVKNLDLSSKPSMTSTIVSQSVKNKKAKEIDPTKKSKLLQALKAIDGSEEQVN